MSHGKDGFDELNYSAFCVIPVDVSPIFNKFVRNRWVLLIHNKPDNEGIGSGKPAGWGNPGGGLDEGQYEYPSRIEDVARREAEEETGLSLRCPMKLALTPNKAIVKPKRDNGNPHRFKIYEDMANRPSVRAVLKGFGIDPDDKNQRRQVIVADNPYSVFVAEPAFKDSFLCKLFHSVKTQLVESGNETEESIFDNGLCFFIDQLSDDDKQKIGVDMSEVDGVGIFPLSALSQELTNPTLTVNNKRAFYTSHLLHVHRATEKLPELFKNAPVRKPQKSRTTKRKVARKSAHRATV
jgi:8-oxo-dGTP pyrophosphatase MutT (NUDIX family)